MMQRLEAIQRFKDSNFYKSKAYWVDQESVHQSHSQVCEY